MIVKTITDDYYFWNWLKKSDNYSNKFSLEGAKALQAYLDENGTGDEMHSYAIEFDPIAWCVEFSEYDSALEAAQDHGYEEVVDLEPHGSVDLLEVVELEKAQALEWLRDRTTVIELDNGGMIVGEF